jgi:hypothetical protein
MKFEIRERAGVRILERTAPFTAGESALDVIGACLEHGSNRVLVESQALPAAFFELRSGFAGELVQKLVNYQIRFAGVFPSEEAYTERFREFLREARRGQAFRAFADRGAAEAWLAESGART